jgi:hypothetical protein
MPCSTVAAAIGGRIVHNNPQHDLDAQINGTSIRKYLETKYEWGEGQFDNIDWTDHGEMLEKMQMHTRPITHKAIHGWLYTGTWQEKLHASSGSIAYGFSFFVVFSSSISRKDNDRIGCTNHPCSLTG